MQGQQDQRHGVPSSQLSPQAVHQKKVAATSGAGTPRSKCSPGTVTVMDSQDIGYHRDDDEETIPGEPQLPQSLEAIDVGIESDEGETVPAQLEDGIPSITKGCNGATSSLSATIIEEKSEVEIASSEENCEVPSSPSDPVHVRSQEAGIEGLDEASLRSWREQVQRKRNWLEMQRQHALEQAKLEAQRQWELRRMANEDAEVTKRRCHEQARARAMERSRLESSRLTEAMEAVRMRREDDIARRRGGAMLFWEAREHLPFR